jgi:hypothetical protein
MTCDPDAPPRQAFLFSTDPAMRPFKLALALFLCVVLPTLALAGSGYVKVEERLTAQQMRDTGLDRLTPEQLALLNRLLAESTPADAAATSHRQGAPAAAEPTLLGLSDEPIRSRIQGTVSGWAPGTVFVLENGQQWKVLKGEMTLRKPLESPEIVVAPGLVGRWFLQVDEDLPKARVYRID